MTYWRISGFGNTKPSKRIVRGKKRLSNQKHAAQLYACLLRSKFHLS